MNRWAAFTDGELETFQDRFVNHGHFTDLDDPPELHWSEQALLDEIDAEVGRRKQQERSKLVKLGVLPS